MTKPPAAPLSEEAKALAASPLCEICRMAHPGVCTYLLAGFKPRPSDETSPASVSEEWMRQYNHKQQAAIAQRPPPEGEEDTVSSPNSPEITVPDDNEAV